MNANGSSPMRLTVNGGLDSHPAWSPDGSHIAFDTNRHGAANFEIYSMTAKGDAAERLTNHAAVDALPDW